MEKVFAAVLKEYNTNQEPFEVLLLDEPFSHIDNFRKNSLRRKLFSYLKEKEITAIFATHDSADVLSFADELLVLKEGQLIASGYPKSIYNTPKTKYIASLFGDVNEMEIDGQIEFIYPHQLELVEKSDLKVEVTNSYFLGNHFLIEGTHLNNIIFFESENQIPIGSKVHLQKKP
jgi:ABC-type sulfate/molybdate transport systems ATPase subunit